MAFIQLTVLNPYGPNDEHVSSTPTYLNTDSIANMTWEAAFDTGDKPHIPNCNTRIFVYNPDTHKMGTIYVMETLARILYLIAEANQSGHY